MAFLRCLRTATALRTAPGPGAVRPPSAAVVLLALLAGVAGCLAQEADEAIPDPVAGEVRFVALGDFGTGGPDQAKVAEALLEVCGERGCDLVLGLGDLIYPSGASSPDDPQFDSKFEQPYAALDVPFWMSLGNHDNGGEFPGPTATAGGLGASYATGNNMVAYAQRTDRASDKWHMPARFYSFTEGPVDFLALDTNTMLFYGLAVPPEVSAGIQEQEAWLRDAPQAGTSPWKVAFGHHPYLSNGEHGDAGSYDGHGLPGAGGDHLKALVEEHLCDEVDLYLSGHDHNLQWLAPASSCGRTALFVSGGGGAGLYELPGENPAVFQAASLGFWWFRIAGETLEAAAFDQEGTLLYEGAVAKPLPLAGAGGVEQPLPSPTASTRST